ncbi:YdeI/OmpD-associated family protein [Pararhizobium sp. BT-229]|uniref:YdeI/OmpD-associated family protein n=1 Tax=Pararhizobium sp. BT-229 TaxID=2986923 RepID=UPI0021F79985|nr:YdeI/OmpD-associated family protein [Pararhizobium sp. BT-229]MCV9963365.1 YdeI/OmpD-associated family protein [Pararhizobium sp. BT-229]
MSAKDQSELPVQAFADAAEWERWLSTQPATSTGLWLKFAKKASGVPTVSKPDAIDAALCHGWIDGQLKPFDENYWLIRFTPRRPKGKWSAINCKRAEALIEEGRMRPAGLAKIERAKVDGRWAAAYESQSRITVPDDLQQALDENEGAKAFFGTLDSANRYSVLYRVHTATKPETRARTVEKLVAMLARGETFHPRKGKPT